MIPLVGKEGNEQYSIDRGLRSNLCLNRFHTQIDLKVNTSMISAENRCRYSDLIALNSSNQLNYMKLVLLLVYSFVWLSGLSTVPHLNSLYSWGTIFVPHLDCFLFA